MTMARRHIWLVGLALTTIAGSLASAQPQKQPQMKERKVTAAGAMAEVDEANHKVLLSGGAKLTTEEGTITSNEVVARLAEDNTIQVAEARGDVKLDLRYTTKDGLERAMQGAADRATYDAKERTVQLVGHVAAKLSEPSRHRTLDISADEVTFWIDQNRLVIRPAQLVFTEMVPAKPAAPAPEKPAAEKPSAPCEAAQGAAPPAAKAK
jgi:lipopolysaccharide transport protein LptA